MKRLREAPADCIPIKAGRYQWFMANIVRNAKGAVERIGIMHEKGRPVVRSSRAAIIDAYENIIAEAEKARIERERNALAAFLARQGVDIASVISQGEV